MERQLQMLELAIAKGPDAAIKKFGSSISVSEADALKSLTTEELQDLLRVQTKISAVKAGAIGKEAADWTCVNTVC